MANTIGEIVLERFRVAADLARQEEEATKTKARLKEIERRIIDEMENLGTDSISTPEGPSVSLSSELHANVTKEHQGFWYDFLMSHGYTDAIKPSVHHKTQDAIVKEMIGEGLSLPEYVNIYEEPRLNFRSNGFKS